MEVKQEQRGPGSVELRRAEPDGGPAEVSSAQRASAAAARFASATPQPRAVSPPGRGFGPTPGTVAGAVPTEARDKGPSSGAPGAPGAARRLARASPAYRANISYIRSGRVTVPHAEAIAQLRAAPGSAAHAEAAAFRYNVAYADGTTDDMSAAQVLALDAAEDASHSRALTPAERVAELLAICIAPRSRDPRPQPHRTAAAAAGGVAQPEGLGAGEMETQRMVPSDADAVLGGGGLAAGGVGGGGRAAGQSAGEGVEDAAAVPGGLPERKFHGLTSTYTKAKGRRWLVRIRVDNEDFVIGYFTDAMEGASLCARAGQLRLC